MGAASSSGLMNMLMIVLLIVGILISDQYYKRKRKRQSITSDSTSVDMRTKYAVLLKHILEGERDCRVTVEGNNYIRIGVSNEKNGNTMFHIQQCPDNIVIIDYEVLNNPVVGEFKLTFTFQDSMDQNKMMKIMALGVQRRITGIMI